ncbi:type II secretion system protein GspM [Sphingopyxis sp. MWB1]|uniref:type II secretion system protein GspM n=1 Tax=Sphingopyxis sp. MWB1 TaxID=1537715 RepID=UPI00051A33E7|nr:type II secretion system protein GspM [Sphingopyxis sp. MWB1]
MMEAMKNWWAGLSNRERWLMGVAGVLALGVLLWAVARPTYAAFVDLQAGHRAAVEREGRVAAKLRLLAQPTAPLSASPGGAALAIDQYLAQSAGEIGLTLDRNEGRGERGVAIAIARAKAPVLIDWLAGLESQGFIIDQLNITPGADGTVGLTAELRKAGQ